MLVFLVLLRPELLPPPLQATGSLACSLLGRMPLEALLLPRLCFQWLYLARLYLAWLFFRDPCTYHDLNHHVPTYHSRAMRCPC